MSESGSEEWDNHESTSGSGGYEDDDDDDDDDEGCNECEWAVAATAVSIAVPATLGAAGLLLVTEAGGKWSDMDGEKGSLRMEDLKPGTEAPKTDPPSAVKVGVDPGKGESTTGIAVVERALAANTTLPEACTMLASQAPSRTRLIALAVARLRRTCAHGLMFIVIEAGSKLPKACVGLMALTPWSSSAVTICA